jgi:hypothetical protein
MKRTNTLLSSFWVKAVPVILLLACIGIASANAQNYKPFNEAVSSVKISLDDLKTQKIGSTIGQGNPGPAKTNGPTTAQAQSNSIKTLEVSYFDRFLELAKENQDIAQAVQALDAEINANGQPAARATTLTAARNDLMHLITY